MQEPEPGDLLGRRWGDASSMPLLRVTLAVDSSDPPVHLCISLLPQHVQPAAGTVAEEALETDEEPDHAQACGDLLGKLLRLLDGCQHAVEALCTAGELLGEARAALGDAAPDSIAQDLDDVMLRLAELQLEHDNTGSSAAALAKACKCVVRLCNHLLAGLDRADSTGRLAAEGQAACKSRWAALRRESAAVAAVQDSLAHVLAAASCSGHARLTSLEAASAHLQTLLEQQSQDLSACAGISMVVASLATHCRCETSTGSGSIMSPASSGTASAASSTAASPRASSPRPSSRLGKVSTPSNPAPGSQSAATRGLALTTAQMDPAADLMAGPAARAFDCSDLESPMAEVTDCETLLSDKCASMPRWSNPVYVADSCTATHGQETASSSCSASPVGGPAGAARSSAHDMRHSDSQQHSTPNGSDPDALPVWVDMPSPVRHRLAPASQLVSGGVCSARDAAAADGAAAAAGGSCTPAAGAAPDGSACRCRHGSHPASSAVSVCLEEHSSHEVLGPWGQLQQPQVLASRLLPCKPQSPQDFMGVGQAAEAGHSQCETQPANCKAALEAALVPAAVCPGDVVCKQPLPLVGHAATVACCPVSLLEASSTLAAVLQHAPDGLTGLKPLKTHRLQNMQEHGSLGSKQQGIFASTQDIDMQPTATTSPWQQLLATLHHASDVLGPAAAAAFQAEGMQLPPLQLSALRAALDAGVADAARVQELLLTLVQQVQQASDAPLPGAAGACGMHPLSLGTAAGSGPCHRQDSAGSWTIAAGAGERHSHSSHGSSCRDGLDETLNSTIGSNFMTALNETLNSTRDGALFPQHSNTGSYLRHSLSSDGGMLAAAVPTAAPEAAAKATEASGVCSNKRSSPAAAGLDESQQLQPQLQERLPSLELMQAAGDVGGLLADDSGSLLFMPEPQVCLGRLHAAAEPHAAASVAAQAGQQQQQLDHKAPAEALAAANAGMAPAPGLFAPPAAAAATVATDVPSMAALNFPASPTSAMQVQPLEPQHAQGVSSPQQGLSRPHSGLGWDTPGPTAPASSSGSPVTDCSNSTGPGAAARADISPRQSHSCLPPSMHLGHHMRSAMKGLKRQFTHQTGRHPTADAAVDCCSSPPHHTLQQQLMLVWSLREQLAAAEQELQQHQGHADLGQLPSSRPRAATTDGVLSHAAPQAAAGALTKQRRNTCGDMPPSQDKSGSHGVTFVQQALKAFLAATSRPGSPAQVVGTVQEDGLIVIKSVSSSTAAQLAGSGTAQQGTSSSGPSTAVQHAAAVTSCDGAAAAQSGHGSMDVQQQVLQQHEDALAAAHISTLEQDCVGGAQQQDPQSSNAQTLGGAAVQAQHAGDERQPAAHMQLEQAAADAAGACTQEQQPPVEQQLLQAQERERELERQLTATLQHLEALAQHHERAAQQLLQQAQSQDHSKASDSTEADAAVEQVITPCGAEVELQQPQDAQHEQQELQELLLLHQDLLVRLQASAAEAVATATADASLEQQRQLEAMQQQDRMQVQQELETLQQDKLLLQQQLEATTNQALQLQHELCESLDQQQQKDALHDAQTAAAATACEAAQQYAATQLQESQQQVQQLTELLCHHEALVLQLQEFQQEAAAEQCKEGSCLLMCSHAVTASDAETAAAAAPTPVAMPASDAASCTAGTSEAGHGSTAQGQYTEQVVQELAAEVDRLLKEQAAAVGLSTQLAAAAERNAALQAEVDALSAALAELHQQAQAATAPPALHPQPVEQHQHMLHSAVLPVSAATVAPPGRVAARQQAPGSAEEQQEVPDADLLAAQVQQEHARASVLQQQLQASASEAAAAIARAAQLQTELQAAQECSQVLRGQLAAMAATIAYLEPGAAESELHGWPVPSHSPKTPPPRRQQQGQQQGQRPACTAVFDAAAQAELVRGLSDALNKQAELQELLQQRDRQLQELLEQPGTAPLTAAGSCAGQVAAALKLLQGPHSVPGPLPDTTCQGGPCSGAAAASADGAASTLAAKVAALLASSPPRGCGAVASPGASSAAAAAHACSAALAGDDSSSSTGARQAGNLAEAGAQGDAHAGDSGLQVSEGHRDSELEGAASCCDSHSSSAGLAGNGSILVRSAVGCEAGTTGLASWGSLEGRHTSCPGSDPIGNGSAAVQHAAGLHTIQHDRVCQLSCNEEASAPPLQQQQQQCGPYSVHAVQPASHAGAESPWGTGDGTEPKAAVRDLHNLSLHEKEVRDLRAELAVREQHVAGMSQQLASAQAALEQQGKEPAAVAQQLCAAKEASAAATQHCEVAFTCRGAQATQAAPEQAAAEAAAVAATNAAAGAEAVASAAAGASFAPTAQAARQRPPRLPGTAYNTPGTRPSPAASSAATLLWAVSMQGGLPSSTTAIAAASAGGWQQTAGSWAMDGHSGAVDLPPSAEATPPGEQEAEAEFSDQHGDSPETGPQPLSAAALAVITKLVEVTRASAARAAAAESQQQQLAQELLLQQELQELDHKECAVLRQRLAAVKEEAAQLAARLQDKQRNLQQLQRRTAKQQQEREEQWERTVKASTAAAPPTRPLRLVSKKVAYAAAATPEAAKNAPASGTAAAASARPGCTEEDALCGTPATAAVPQQSCKGPAAASVGTSTLAASSTAAPAAAAAPDARYLAAASSLRSSNVAAQPLPAATDGVAAAAGGCSPVGPSSRGTLSRAALAGRVAASAEVAGSPKAQHLQQQLAKGLVSSHVATAAGRRGNTRLAKSVDLGSLSSQTNVKGTDGRGDKARAAQVLYARAEEVRQLQRELVVKERCIAGLQSTNRLRIEQLQQLAQSAARAGLQVTPQHLLHIAHVPGPCATSSPPKP